IDNKATISWTDGPGPYIYTDIKNTILNGKSVLNLYKSRVGTNAAVVPGNIIKYRLEFNSNESTINNAILTDLLPSQVEYVSPLGTVNSTYYNYFTGTNQPMSYKVNITPNYNSTGRTLATFTILTPIIFEQNSYITVDFDVIVKVGASGIISNQGSIDSSNNLNPGIKTLSNIVDTNISFNNSLASDKKVKGALDTNYTEFPAKGKTYDGGTLEYKLTLSNTGNLNLEELEVVDIFPHIGDTGVILTDNPRGSQFDVYLTNTPQITVMSTDPSMPVPTVTIQYSNSYDPVRFGPTNNIIGLVNDWTTVMPYPTNQVKSIKLNIKDTSLKPGQSIVVTIQAQVPVGLSAITPPLVAWNSFALKGAYKNQHGVLTNFLPVEPEKVGITVEPPIYKGKIGDFTWHDNYEVGVYNPSIDTAINNVTVYLYNEDPTINPLAVPIATAITNNNSLGQPGYYLFSNLPTDTTYYLKFIPPLGFEYTVQDLGPNGSRPDPNNGVVKNIVLTNDNPIVLDVDAGFIDKICETNHIEQCLYLEDNSKKIEYIDISKSFLYISIDNAYLDKSTIVYKEYFGNIVPGHNLYVSSNIEYHLHYNNNEFQLYNKLYESILFVPEYVQDNLVSVISSTSNVGYFICGCRKAFFIDFDLTVCINFK
ncbi:MAG: SdrD B-like domain-containing protein, partial [Paraclostridium sp.]